MSNPDIFSPSGLFHNYLILGQLNLVPHGSTYFCEVPFECSGKSMVPENAFPHLQMTLNGTNLTESTVRSGQTSKLVMVLYFCNSELKF